MPSHGPGPCWRGIRRSSAAARGNRRVSSGPAATAPTMRRRCRTHAWCLPNRCACIRLLAARSRGDRAITTYADTRSRAGRWWLSARGPFTGTTILSRARAIRPGSVVSRIPGRPPAVLVLSVRRRHARMHGRGLRVDGGRAAGRRVRAAMALRLLDESSVPELQPAITLSRNMAFAWRRAPRLTSRAARDARNARTAPRALPPGASRSFGQS